MQKNNKGYSLVELIVVIAIIALLSGTAFLSISIIFGASAKTCANDIKEVLAENKVTAMGKSEAKVEIYRDATDNCIYAEQRIKEGGVWKTEKVEKIGNSRVYVSYKPDGGAETELKVGKENALQLCFDRSNGSFSTKSDDCILCEEIYIKGGSRSYVLTLIELTGKVELDLK